MNVLDWINIVLYLIPVIESLIRTIETPGNGPEKRATVIAATMAVLDVVLKLSGLKILTPEQEAMIAGYIGTIVDIIVGVFNKTGKFVHKA